MAEQEFFQQRPEVTSTIYAYELLGVASHKGLQKQMPGPLRHRIRRSSQYLIPQRSMR
jgi:hypothetical protein